MSNRSKKTSALEFRKIVKWVEKKWDRNRDFKGSPGIIKPVAFKEILKLAPLTGTDGETAPEDKLEAAGKRFIAKNKGMATSAESDIRRQRGETFEISFVIGLIDGEKNDKKLAAKWVETHVFPALKAEFTEVNLSILKALPSSTGLGGETFERFIGMSEMEIIFKVS